jgi:hypothetical protein
MGLRGGDRFIAGWFKLLLRGLWHEEIGSMAKWLGWICDWNKVVGRWCFGGLLGHAMIAIRDC